MPFSPDRDWLDYATLAIAVSALGLSLWNVWSRRARLEIRLRGAFEPPDRLDQVLETNASMEIYNPGTHPILVVEAGFAYRNGMQTVINGRSGTSSSQSFPYRLQARESFLASADALLLAHQAVNLANPTTHAWVRRQVATSRGSGCLTDGSNATRPRPNSGLVRAD